MLLVCHMLDATALSGWSSTTAAPAGATSVMPTSPTVRSSPASAADPARRVRDHLRMFMKLPIRP